jgi:hypothetical protein
MKFTCLVVDTTILVLDQGMLLLDVDTVLSQS